MAHTEVGFQVINKFLAEIAPSAIPIFRRNSSGRGHQRDGQPAAAQQARKKSASTRRRSGAGFGQSSTC